MFKTSKAMLRVKDIKSDFVRQEAIRLAIEYLNTYECKVLEMPLQDAFDWDLSPQGYEFWEDINDGTIKNNGWVQLPN
jgi:hypothetical protein